MLIYNKDKGTNSIIQPQGTFITSMKQAQVSDPIKDLVLSFKYDVYRYCKLLGFEPNFQQKELLDAYTDAITGRGLPNITCRAGKGPGKTAASTVVMTHWSLTHPNSSLIVTAPTFRQCQSVWLAEARARITSSTADPRIAKMFNFVGKGFGVLGARPDEWGCQLITALTEEAFQGIHSKFIAFLEEEASGVRESISRAIAGTLSNAKGTYLHIKIGNPNSRNCPFYYTFNKDKDRWKRLHWNTEETPETPYFSRRRNEEIAEEFGKNSNVYRIAVKGEFPNVDPDCLLSDEELEECIKEETLQNVLLNNPDQQKQIGIDLARYGGDECVIVWRQGGILFDMWADTTDPNNAIDKAVLGQVMYDWEDADCMYVVDTSGMGESVVGVLGGSKYMGKKVHEFYSQNGAYLSNKYEDKITEAWCLFAKLVKHKLVYLGETLDKKLKNQLTTRRYIVNRKTGRIQIESKDAYKTNNKDSEHGDIGKSPDRADALVMAFYEYATESLRIAIGR